MKIVVLDGHTANPGDLSWAEFAKLGSLEVFERTGVDQIAGRLTGASVAITNKAIIGREAIAQLPDLRYIGVIATGYNVVDVHAATARNITVCNVPEYGTNEVAQAAFALLLELTNRVGHHAATVRDGKWSQSPDFCYWDYPLVSLAGLTLGLVGYGRIGQAVARLGKAFGMRVLAVKRRTPGLHDDLVEFVGLEKILGESDVVSLHCPLTLETKHLINAQTLAKMKRSAYLINTARGGLVEEASLAQALNAELLAGAGLDVLSSEPPAIDNPLLKARNCMITPHIAWAARNSRARLLQISAENIRSWLEGNPKNVVVPQS